MGEICYICLSDDIYYGGDLPFVCDRCNEYYCHDCAYSFTLHFQYYGMLCYHCSDQSRIKPLNIRDYKIDYILKK